MFNLQKSSYQKNKDEKSNIRFLKGEKFIDQFECLSSNKEELRVIISNFRLIFTRNSQEKVICEQNNQEKNENDIVYLINQKNDDNDDIILQLPLNYIQKIVNKQNFSMKNVITDIYNIYSQSQNGRIKPYPQEYIINLVCKDQFEQNLFFQDEKSHQEILEILEKQIKVTTDQLFAYDFYHDHKHLDTQYNGWNIYDPIKELIRQRVNFDKINQYIDSEDYEMMLKNADWKILDNSQGQWCHTYPKSLVVPFNMSNLNVIACSKFRSSHRFPTMSFFYQKEYTSLWRSSQCMTGIAYNRSVDDENMVLMIGNPSLEFQNTQNQNMFEQSSQPITVHIYDVRPLINALGNKMFGKGYEEEYFYSNSKVFHLALENIHIVRISYHKICNLYWNNLNSQVQQNFKQKLIDTQWIQLLEIILSASQKVCESLKTGFSVLVHCSDGWDRTSQVNSLAMIMIDPYYRTFEGFIILIEKEWVSFGHQFQLRGGHGISSIKDQTQISPIFFQFLDCVHQIMIQNPDKFEFKISLLLDIFNYSQLGIFGTFLANCYQDQLSKNLSSTTLSLWSYLLSQKQNYSLKISEQFHNSIELQIKNLQIWNDYFGQFQKIANQLNVCQKQIS